ncbi:family 43 glycosylhydrolase [Microbacterium sp. W1N]|uniref:family 43 glycosylhydrolase n=1 Tax=Microbacterium festucae TaxID=2977531 RepID=UPI0021C1C54F|nr:family 43 glycosylhydrolase [Microbacterium festucae]MCT9819804.1 family 43 glycosylhydrolase [Microbacterium festucae]
MTATELYRDPVYDGATDPVVRVVGDRWWMFYTQRRASHPAPGPGVAWVHGSRIGIAHSDDGRAWRYAGTLEPDAVGDRLALRAGAPPAEVERTYWAPEVIHDGDRWRMYVTEIDGIPTRWEGHAREIVEYVSDDLARWQRRGAVPLASDRVIDAAVARTPDGRWRLWCKDEAADSVTRVAVSDDLSTWQVEGTAVGGRPHEGPTVFALGGSWWMIVDEWRGMAVHRSPDAVTWERQGGPDAVVLAAGAVPGPGFGHHGAVLQHDGDTWLYFFGHPARAYDPSSSHTADADERRCAVYRARLQVTDGLLHVAPE